VTAQRPRLVPLPPFPPRHKRTCGADTERLRLAQQRDAAAEQRGAARFGWLVCLVWGIGVPSGAILGAALYAFGWGPPW
jgi:hypothetical protein